MRLVILRLIQRETLKPGSEASNTNDSYEIADDCLSPLLCFIPRWGSIKVVNFADPSKRRSIRNLQPSLSRSSIFIKNSAIPSWNGIEMEYRISRLRDSFIEAMIGRNRFARVTTRSNVEGWGRDADFPRSRISADSWKQQGPRREEAKAGGWPQRQRLTRQR